METAFGCLFCFFMFGVVAYNLYINGWGWTVYAVGGLFVGWAIISLIQSYLLKQKAERLGRISEDISKNWK
ncbi:MAG: hypothetical protein ACRCU2_01665 [Planktothrix sp.]